MKIYNGEGVLLGRLATRVAKDALLGEEVRVVNCDQVIISGKKINTFAREKQRRARKGYPLKSAKLPRLSDRIVRRSIRGMLPWKQTRGREAFKRIMCYKQMPEDFNGKELIVIKEATKEKLPNLRYSTIKEICKALGGK